MAFVCFLLTCLQFGGFCLGIIHNVCFNTLPMFVLIYLEEGVFHKSDYCVNAVVTWMLMLRCLFFFIVSQFCKICSMFSLQWKSLKLYKKHSTPVFSLRVFFTKLWHNIIILCTWSWRLNTDRWFSSRAASRASRII